MFFLTGLNQILLMLSEKRECQQDFCIAMYAGKKSV